MAEKTSLTLFGGQASVWCPQEKLLSLKTCGRIMELQVPRLSAAADDSVNSFPSPFAAGGFRLDGRVSRDNAFQKSETYL
jgi:hypothetical protein